MALTSAATAQIVKAHQRAEGDTGSSEVQISLLTARIEYLTQHMKANPHDYHTRYGLTKMVSQRRRLMSYYKRVNPVGYRQLIEKLDLRG
jgi:small subunit ribosomal protein S15